MSAHLKIYLVFHRGLQNGIKILNKDVLNVTWQLFLGVTFLHWKIIKFSNVANQRFNRIGATACIRPSDSYQMSVVSDSENLLWGLLPQHSLTRRSESVSLYSLCTHSRVSRFVCGAGLCFLVPGRCHANCVASPKTWEGPKYLGGGKMFDFRQITLFCFKKKRLSKHKMTICSKNWGGHGPFGPPGYAYGSRGYVLWYWML